MEGRNTLSNEIDLRSSRVAVRLAAVEQISVLDHKSAPAVQVSKKRYEQVKKKKDLSNTDSGRSARSSSSSDLEEEHRSSRNSLQHRRFSPAYRGKKKDPRYSELKELSPNNPLYVRGESSVSGQ